MASHGKGGSSLQESLHRIDYMNISSLFAVNGKVSAPEGFFLLFLEIPNLRSLIQPLLMEEESHGLESVTPVKKETAEMGRAQLHLELYQADMESYFGSSKHNYFLRQKNYFS